MDYILQDDDIRILRLLQHDARLTTKEIADKLGKSQTPVYERIRRLEKEGYIVGYVALLDKNKIQRSLIAFSHVQLKEHSSAMLNAFKESTSKFPEVMECYQMTGEYDFILKVVVKDMNEYNEFYNNTLSALPNIRTVQSFFVLSEGKVATAYPLPFSNKPPKKA